MDKKDFLMPPGQRPSARLYPVSVFGKPKEIDTKKYRISITGLIKEERTFSLEDIYKLSKDVRQFDIHCVDGWSYLGHVFSGVSLVKLFKEVKLAKNANFALVKSIDGYTTDLPISFLLSDEVLLAYEMDGKPLEIANGYPLRLVVNGKYAYKDAKWVIGFEIMEKDRPGFWEEKGYSRNADIYKNERKEI